MILIPGSETEPLDCRGGTRAARFNRTLPFGRQHDHQTMRGVRRSVVVYRILDGFELESDHREQVELYRNLMFGQRDTSVTTQIRDCSNSQVILEPASADPVRSIVLSAPRNPSNIAQWKDALAESVFPYSLAPLEKLRRQADHVLIILPPSFPDDFVAEAEVGSSISVYSREWSTSISTICHELGHNGFGQGALRHASAGTDPYGDTTGYMGHSWPILNQKCYNAAQHWRLGWFPHHRHNVASGTVRSSNRSLPYLQEVAAFVDVRQTNKPVLLRIPPNYFVQFNRAKTYNRHTSIFLDQLVVVQDMRNHTRLTVALEMGENATVGQVFLQVCDLRLGTDEGDLDYAIVGIGEGACDLTPSPLTPSPWYDTVLRDPMILGGVMACVVALVLLSVSSWWLWRRRATTKRTRTTQIPPNVATKSSRSSSADTTEPSESGWTFWLGWDEESDTQPSPHRGKWPWE